MDLILVLSMYWFSESSVGFHPYSIITGITSIKAFQLMIEGGLLESMPKVISLFSKL